jgi:transposase-like protein
MSDMIPTKTPAKRRRHSPEFKASVLNACREPDVSVASVALQYGINANLIHKWRRAADGNQKSAQKDFVSVPLPTLAATEDVVFELSGLKVSWPLAQIDRAIPWLRALQL